MEGDLAALLAEIRANTGMYYVYLLSYPDGTPFYVGCGKARKYHPRILDHERLAFSSSRYRHSLRSSIIRKIVDSGDRMGRSIDSWHLDFASMFAREMELIASIGRRDQGRGPLANGNDGGTGQINSTPEVRAKMAAGLAAWWTDERRAAAKETAKQRFRTPQARERLREVLSSSEWRARQSVRIKEVFRDPLKAKKILDASNEAHRTPAYRKRRSEIATAQFASSSARREASRKQKAVWQDSAYREKGQQNLRNMSARRWSLPGARERASQKGRAVWTPEMRAAAAERMKRQRAAQIAAKKAI